MKTKFSWPFELRTRRLILRPFARSDYKAWAKSYEVSRAGSFTPVGSDGQPLRRSAFSRPTFEKMLGRHRQIAAADKVYVWAVFRRSGEFLGMVDVGVIQRGSFQWANLGYSLHSHAWGQGFATEATRAVVKAAFKKMGFHRLEAAINLYNQASIRVAEKIGMHRECLRKRFFFEHGEWTDHVIYVVMPGDIGLREYGADAEGSILRRSPANS